MRQPGATGEDHGSHGGSGDELRGGQPADRCGAVLGTDAPMQPGAEIVRDVGDRAVPLGRVLPQAELDHMLQLGRHVLGERRRGVVNDRVQRVDERGALERLMTCQELVEDRAEGEDVAALVDRASGHLLGRHVRRRAEDLPFLRQSQGRRVSADGRGEAVAVDQLGQAEVDDLGVALAGDEDVVGLEVAVDDPRPVRLGQAVGDLGHHLDAPPQRQRGLDGLAQRRAVDELHGDVVDLIPPRRPPSHDGLDVQRRPRVPDFVDGDDVGVAQCRRRPRFVGEAPHTVAVIDEIGGQDLQRHVAVESPVMGAVDVAHRPAPGQGNDPVPPDVRAGREWFRTQRLVGCQGR